MKRNKAYIKSGRLDRGRVDWPKEMEKIPPQISEQIPVPQLSAVSGYYRDGFDLTIDGGGLDVYFTLDGSSPYTSGMLYSGAIPIIDRSSQDNYYSALGPISLLSDQYMPDYPVPKACVVRAVAQRKNGTFSKESVATFWVGDQVISSGLGTCMLSIVSDTEGLFSGKDGIYVTGRVWENNMEKALELDANLYEVPSNYNMRGRGWHREARLTLLDETGACLYDETDTIAIHGNWTRALNQKGFNLRPLQDGERVFDGLLADSGPTLVLRTGGTDDRHLTNFRDVLNNEVARDLQVASQRSIVCQVYLNGEYWGCYNLQDRLDAGFIEARYGVDRESVNLIKNFEAVLDLEKDYEQYLELEEFVRENDLSDDLNYQQFCNIMDIESLIDYYCCEIFFDNEDAYDNNVALWRTRERGNTPYADAKWRFVLIDTDLSLMDPTLDSFVEGHCRGYNPDEELFFSNLIVNDTFRKQFLERFRYLVGNDFSYERAEPIITALEKAYSKPMVESLHRFVDPAFTQSDYHQNVEDVRTFYRERGDYILSYLQKHYGESYDGKQ